MKINFSHAGVALAKIGAVLAALAAHPELTKNTFGKAGAAIVIAGTVYSAFTGSVVQPAAPSEAQS